MARVLMVVDYRSRKRNKSVISLREKGYSPTMSVVANAKEKLKQKKAWELIVIDVDSIRSADDLVKKIRTKKSPNNKTPIVCVRPTLLGYSDLSLVYSHENLVSTVGSILTAKR